MLAFMLKSVDGSWTSAEMKNVAFFGREKLLPSFVICIIFFFGSAAASTFDREQYVSYAILLQQREEK